MLIVCDIVVLFVDLRVIVFGDVMFEYGVCVFLVILLVWIRLLWLLWLLGILVFLLVDFWVWIVDDKECEFGVELCWLEWFFIVFLFECVCWFVVFLFLLMVELFLLEWLDEYCEFGLIVLDGEGLLLVFIGRCIIG